MTKNILLHAEEPIAKEETTVKDNAAEEEADDTATEEATQVVVAEPTTPQPRSLGTNHEQSSLAA